MKIQATKKQAMEPSMPPDKVSTCQRCHNTYILIWMIKGDDYNDFGLRYCPFCGLIVDETTGSIVE